MHAEVSIAIERPKRRPSVYLLDSKNHFAIGVPVPVCSQHSTTIYLFSEYICALCVGIHAAPMWMRVTNGQTNTHQRHFDFLYVHFLFSISRFSVIYMCATNAALVTAATAAAVSAECIWQPIEFSLFLFHSLPLASTPSSFYI